MVVLLSSLFVSFLLQLVPIINHSFIPTTFISSFLFLKGVSSTESEIKPFHQHLRHILKRIPVHLLCYHTIHATIWIHSIQVTPVFLVCGLHFWSAFKKEGKKQVTIVVALTWMVHRHLKLRHLYAFTLVTPSIVDHWLSLEPSVTQDKQNHE